MFDVYTPLNAMDDLASAVAFDNEVTAAIDAQCIVAPQYGIGSPEPTSPDLTHWAGQCWAA